MNNLIALRSIDDIPLHDVYVSDIVKLNYDYDGGNFGVVIINRDDNRVLYSGQLRELAFNFDGIANPVCNRIVLGIRPILETESKTQVMVKLEILV